LRISIVYPHICINVAYGKNEQNNFINRPNVYVHSGGRFILLRSIYVRLCMRFCGCVSINA
jgi:hypothetical protein